MQISLEYSIILVNISVIFFLCEIFQFIMYVFFLGLGPDPGTKLTKAAEWSPAVGKRHPELGGA